MSKLLKNNRRQDLGEPISAAITAAATIASIGAKQGWFSGGGEKGSGKTQPNTLAHAIDQLNKANDIEALRIAPQALKMKLDGANDLEVQRYIDEQLGYEYKGPYIGGKWKYIMDMLHEAERKARHQMQQQQGQNDNNENNQGNLLQAATTGTASNLFAWGVGIFVLGGGTYWLVNKN